MPLKPEKIAHPFEKSNKNRASQAIDFIEGQIRDGVYLPGQRLVEADVAADSGLGIVPIREAIRQLAGEGVLDLVPYRGATIKHLTREDLLQMVQALFGVVRMGISLAAKADLNVEDKARLWALIDEIQSIADRRRAPEFINALGEYHKLLHDLGGNRYLNVLWDRMHVSLFNRELAMALIIEDWDAYANVYRRLNTEVLARNEEKAIEVMDAHGAWLVDNLESKMERR